MVFVWGSKNRLSEDAVTASDTWECPKCTYKGRLLLYRNLKKLTVYFIPAGPWRSDGAIMVCPACGNDFFLSKRKYKKLARVDSGAELVAARREIETAVQAIIDGREA